LYAPFSLRPLLDRLQITGQFQRRHRINNNRRARTPERLDCEKTGQK
jgi:hypothetical protein